MPAASTPARARPVRARNPRGAGQRLRDDLIEAASRLLVGQAADEPLSLRAVARAVGVVPQAVYLHFPDKRRLVWAVVERCFAELAQAGEDAAAAVNDPVDQLRAWCLAYCRFGLDQPGHYALLFESRATGQLGVGFADSPGAAVFDRLVAAVQRCMDAGAAPREEAASVATSLWAGLHGVVSLRRTKPGFPWPPVEKLLERLLIGLVGIDRRHLRSDAGSASGPV